ncbi:MAG: shikimate kinase [Lachnospiraceae bacterium]|nr:shikimate kinase [Lachnospiraceae bacterium]
MKNIILIGYMGCGKTTVGKNLARICGYTFLDTDEWIEEQQGRSISEIFATDGEEAFREMETQCIQTLIDGKLEGYVISTGGGMPVREVNRQLLKKLGKVIYLSVKPETVYERIKGDTKRPLLQCDDPLSKIKDMIAMRAPAYRDGADYIVRVDTLKQYTVALKIKKLVMKGYHKKSVYKSNAKKNYNKKGAVKTNETSCN